jgi:hypothetical protein
MPFKVVNEKGLADYNFAPFRLPHERPSANSWESYWSARRWACSQPFLGQIVCRRSLCKRVQNL